MLANLSIDLSLEETQDKIAALLGALDEKLHSTQKNSTLKAIAKTFYDYWLVQFYFPDKHGKPYNPAAARLFTTAKSGRVFGRRGEIF